MPLFPSPYAVPATVAAFLDSLAALRPLPGPTPEVRLQRSEEVRAKCAEQHGYDVPALSSLTMLEELPALWTFRCVFAQAFAACLETAILTAARAFDSAGPAEHFCLSFQLTCYLLILLFTWHTSPLVLTSGSTQHRCLALLWPSRHLLSERQAKARIAASAGGGQASFLAEICPGSRTRAHGTIC